MAVTTLTLWDTFTSTAMPEPSEWTPAAAGWPDAFNGTTGDVLTTAANRGMFISGALVDTGVLTSDVITSVVIKFDWALVSSDPNGGIAFMVQPALLSEYGPFSGTTAGSHAENVLPWYTGGSSITRAELFDPAGPAYWGLIFSARYSGTFAPFTIRVTISNFRIEVTDDAPVTVTRVVPAQGRTSGGRLVRISGTNFAGTPIVTFGGTAATSITVVSPTLITARTPAHAAGAVAVAVGSATLADGFLYTDTMFGDLTIRTAQGIAIDDALNDAPNTARLRANPTGADVGAAVRIVDPVSGAVLFGGTALVVTAGIDGRPVHPGYREIQCGDLAWRLNAKRPKGEWVEVSASTVAQNLIDTFAPAFTATHIEPGLPVISVAFAYAQTLTECLSEICSLAGASWYVDEDFDVHVFAVETTDAPDPITDVTPLYNPPPTVTTDLTQVRTRIRVVGARAGSSAGPDVNATYIEIPRPEATNLKAAATAGGSIPNNPTGMGEGQYEYAMTSVIATGEESLVRSVGFGGPLTLYPGVPGTNSFQLSDLDRTIPVYPPTPAPVVVARNLYRSRSVPGDAPITPYAATPLYLVTTFGNTPGIGEDTYLDTKADADLTVPAPIVSASGAITYPAVVRADVEAVVDDAAAQAALAALLNVDGGTDDGVREGYINEPGLTTLEMARARALAELAQFKQPAVTVVYACRDEKSKSGKTVSISLTNPPVAGDFLIQSVAIDQIAIHDQTFPRFTVTASAVRYTLDHLLKRVLLGRAGGGSTGGSGSRGSGAMGTVSTPEAVGVVPSGAINGVNTVFTVTGLITQLKVHKNGLRLKATTDYTISGTSAFTLAVAPRPGDLLTVDYR